ncbi:MAG: cyclic nucleotide-binding domain-containing protein [Elusimicrobia bacterium]|nr:cyclic nucleotide-binding domain-containing protein [Elusimicrobiota bacterium]
MLKNLRKLLYDPTLQAKKDFLRSLELFKDLKDRELAELAQALHCRVYRQGEVLFQEGDIGRALFILESGSVELSRRRPDGAGQPLYKLKPGEFFGEMALLEQLPRAATAQAAEDSRLYLLYLSKLESLIQEHPRLGIQVMTHLAQLLSARLRRATIGATASHASS